jgi:hypothetical protein
MEASWVPASWGFIMMPPLHVARFQAEHDGSWTYSRRDADDLDITARPPKGYEVFGHVRVFTAGPFESGQCPTNNHYHPIGMIGYLPDSLANLYDKGGGMSTPKNR